MDQDTILSIFSGILAIIFLVVVFTFLVFAIIYSIKCNINQKKYISCLNDEQKALILEYIQNGKLPLSVIFKKDND